MGGRGARADRRTGARSTDLRAADFTDRVPERRAVRLCACAPVPPFTHLTYSLSPSLPPSLPNPLSRYPPNPLAASKTLVQLIQTVPALSWGATSSARLMFSVQTLAARP